MKILLIETEAAGHHISLYLNSIVDELILMNYKVSLLTFNNVRNHPSLNYIKKKNVEIIYMSDLKNIKTNNFISIIKSQFKLYFTIKRKIKNLKKFDLIYLNTFTVFDKAISLFGSPFGNTRFIGLFPTIKFYINKDKGFFSLIKNFINYYLFLRLLKIRTLKKVFVPDPNFIKYSNKNINIKNKIKNSIDFGFFNKKKQSTTKKLPKLEKKDKKIIYILVYGSIRFEKGIQHLLNALSEFDKREKFKIIIAGRQDKYTQEIIKYYSKTKNFNKIIVTYNKFIKDSFEKLLFNKCDYVWTGYTKNYFGSSAVFFLAAKYKKPVITSDHGLISYFNRMYKIGKSIKIDDISATKTFLKSLIKKRITISNKNYEKILRIHNQKTFSQNICKSFIKI